MLGFALLPMEERARGYAEGWPPRPSVSWGRLMTVP